MKERLTLAPVPKSLQRKEGTFRLPQYGYVSVDDVRLISSIEIALKKSMPFLQVVFGECTDEAPVIRIFKNNGLKTDEYVLEITAREITVQYSTPASAFYGMMTLNQLVLCETELPCVKIVDYPDFPVRGYLLDISRNKIPKVETVLELIDLLAGFKINHFELYIEGAPFAYRNCPKKQDALTDGNMIEIDRYCRERFIDCVPHQNCFGYLSGEIEEAFGDPEPIAGNADFDRLHSYFDCPMSLNLSDPKSMAFVRELSDDLLSCFSSGKFSVGCNEAMELGLGAAAGKSAEQTERMFFDYLMKLYEYCTSKKKTMLFFGNFLFYHPEIAKRLPKDAVALIWGYEANQPDENFCRVCAEFGIPFYVCPGTNAWRTFTGKTDLMIQNIKTAVRNGKKYGAVGLLLTDWGDGGHLQGSDVSFPGILFSASLAWGYDENREISLAETVSKLIFRDYSGKFGRCLLDAGNYYLQERYYLPYDSLTAELLVNLGQTDVGGIGCFYEKETHDDLEKTECYVGSLQARLANFPIGENEKRKHFIREYNAGLEAVLLAQKCGHYKLYLHENNVPKQKECLTYIIEKVPFIIQELKAVWLVKNLYSKVDASLQLFDDLKNEAIQLLQNTNGKDGM